jgi:hypothetical protein
VNTTRDAIVNAQRDSSVTAQRNATVAAPNGTANVTGENVNVAAAAALTMTGTTITGQNGSQTLHKLMTDAAMAVYNEHTHTDSHGDQSGVPQQQMDNNDLTQTAEFS